MVARCCKSMIKFHAWLSNLIFWNGFIRIVIEFYLDTVLLGSLDLTEYSKLRNLWLKSTELSWWLTFAFISLFSIVPILVTAHFYRSKNKIEADINHLKNSRCRSYFQELEPTNPEILPPATAIQLLFFF